METGNSSESHRKTVSEKDRQRINVLFVCNEWNSSKGGLSTFNREFAINLAKTSSDKIKVHCYVTKSSELEREDARINGVNVITAESIPGTSNPLDWLKLPPPELPHPDIVVGHGRKFGTPAYCIMRTTNCRWIQFVHVFCEDLGKHKVPESPGLDTIEENEKKHKDEIELCKAANVVVAVGSRLQKKYNNCLPDVEVQVITPGILESFYYLLDQRRGKVETSLDEFSIFVFGRASYEDLVLKGYDIIAGAVGSLAEKFKVTFVGAPEGQHRNMEEWFLKIKGLKRKQLTIRGYCDQNELKRMFYEADLVAMPSRTEGFGLVALEAISAGVPVLVTVESGIAKALQKVEGGKSVVVESEEPKEWAQKIDKLSKKTPEERLDNAIRLRENYHKTYSWGTQCERFTEMIGVQRKETCDADHVNGSGAKGAGKTVALAGEHRKREATRNQGASGTEQHNSGTPHSSKRTVSEAFEKSLASKGSGAKHAGKNVKRRKVEATGVDWHANDDSSFTSDRSKCSVTTENEPSCYDKTVSEAFESNLSSEECSIPAMDQKAPTVNSKDRDHASVQSGSSSANKSEQSVGNNGWTLLHAAVQSEDVETILAILSRGFDIDSRNIYGRTPLMIAAESGRLDTFNLLLERGADPSLKDNYGWTLLHRIPQGGNDEIIEKLLSLGLDIDSRKSNGATPLMIAAGNGRLNAFNLLLERGADPTLKDNNGWTVLHWAVQGGSDEIIEKLLSLGLDIDSRKSNGETPLMIAAENGRLNAFNLLLERGADPTLKDNYGLTVLHGAAQGGNDEIIEKLLSLGLDIDSRKSYGATPLMSAALNGRLNAFNLLLKRGADPTLKSNNGWTVLHMAALGGNDEIIEKLLSLGLDIDSRKSDGVTPLMAAADNGRLNAFNLLLERGADATLKGNNGWTMLHWAARGGNDEIIEKLLSLGLDINSREISGETPLMVATSHGQAEAVKYLLSKGAR